MPVKQQKKERGIYEKVPGSGIWWVRYAAADGKEHRELGGKLTDARALVERRRTEKRRGVVPEIRGATKPKLDPAKVMTFGDLINDTLAYSASNNDETHTHELDLKYRKMGDLAKMPPAHVTRTVIQNCLNELAEKKKWADPTYNRYLASVSLVFRIAIENEKLTVNPVHGIRRKQENSGRVRFLSQEEEAALTATIQARNPDYVPDYLLAMHSGMRLSEQLRAQVGDYSPTTGVLLVRQKKVRNAPATRYVPLTPIGVEAYNHLAAGRQPGQPLCNNLNGGPLTEARYWFEPALEKAGIKDFTWHCLRHTFASRAVMSGVPIAAVSKYLGHSTINQTMIYAHLQPDNAARTVAALMGYYPLTPTGTKTGTSTI